mmetsp:Transcript_40983/g.128483  ORF Transcript_40983/g.128483 Transcript_40983/m.128483 type:complete len:95 (+) Transcript_40983:806-1090(+)
MMLNETNYPSGWSGTIKSSWARRGHLERGDPRLRGEHLLGRHRRPDGGDPLLLKPGKIVIVVKAGNHGQEMKEKNQGFLMKFPTDVTSSITLSP